MTDDAFQQWNPPAIDARGLFERALVEVDDLGPKPRTSPERWYFDEEHRGSLALLASLAGHDGHLLRRAAMHAVCNVFGAVPIRMMGRRRGG